MAENLKDGSLQGFGEGEYGGDIIVIGKRMADQLGLHAGDDLTLVSPVFPSDSPSAGPAMGVEAFTALVQAVAVPVYALGGVNTRTAPQLSGSGAQGLAMVEGLLGAVRT